MPKYRIIVSNRYADEYLVTAADKEAASEAVYDDDNDDVVEVRVGTNCVGSDILECELITDEEEE
jgi:hypothetical protein